MTPWLKPGTVVRLHPILDHADGYRVRVYAVANGLVQIGAEKGKTGTAWIRADLIDVPVKVS